MGVEYENGKFSLEKLAMKTILHRAAVLPFPHKRAACRRPLSAGTSTYSTPDTGGEGVTPGLLAPDPRQRAIGPLESHHLGYK